MASTEVTLRSLRREHAELRPHIEGLRIAADAIDPTAARPAFELVDDAYRFLTEHLLVHARTEEEVLYPALTSAIDSTEAVRLLHLDHDAIVGFVRQLADLRRAMADHDHIRPSVAADLRRVLYGLHALIVAHFEKEERVVLPELEDRLTDEELGALVHRLHQHV
jgi:hemerythrin-like domain-containing protein